MCRVENELSAFVLYCIVLFDTRWRWDSTQHRIAGLGNYNLWDDWICLQDVETVLTFVLQFGPIVSNALGKDWPTDWQQFLWPFGVYLQLEYQPFILFWLSSILVICCLLFWFVPKGSVMGYQGLALGVRCFFPNQILVLEIATSGRLVNFRSQLGCFSIRLLTSFWPYPVC